MASAKEQLKSYNKENAFRDPNYGCGTKCSRTTLIVMNICFLILGIVIVAVGSYLLNSNSSKIASNAVTNGIIAMGSFVMALSFLGCFGAYFDNRISLCIYAIILIIIVLCQIVMASVVLADSNQATSFLESAWKSSNNGVWVSLQNSFSCCGLVNFNDTYAGQPCPSGTNTSCISKLRSDFKSKATPLGAVALVFAFIELAGVILALCFRRAIIRASYEIEEDPAKKPAEDSSGNP